jgi:hypothetical protein
MIDEAMLALPLARWVRLGQKTAQWQGNGGHYEILGKICNLSFTAMKPAVIYPGKDGRREARQIN